MAKAKGGEGADYGVTVLDKAGNPVRTYVSNHSDEIGFEAKAEGYAEKIGGTTRKATETEAERAKAGFPAES